MTAEGGVPPGAAGAEAEARRVRTARRLRRRRERLFGRLLAYLSIVTILFVVFAALTEIEAEPLRLEMLRLIGAVYDREVTLEGASINLIGGVRLKGLRIHNPPGFAYPYFLEAPDVKVQVQLLPFGQNRIMPRRLILEGATVRIERLRGGGWNIEGLTRPPPEPRPAFSVNVEIEDGTFEYVDGETGDSGFVGVLRGMDASYIIKSGRQGLTAEFALQDEVLDDPAGARVDIGIRTFPIEKRTTLYLFLRGFDFPHFREFYRWLPEFEIEAGRGTLEADAEFRPDFADWRARVGIEGIRAVHTRSGRRWEDGALDVSFDLGVADTEVEIRRFEVSGGRTRLVATGRSATRRVARPFEAIEIDVPEARLEEIAFFAADTRLAVEGPGRGRYRFDRDGADSRYEVEIEASGADVRYGAWFRKPAGVAGRARVEGVPAGGIRQVDLSFAGTAVSLRPAGGGVDVSGRSIRLRDVRAFVPAVPLRRQPWLDVDGTADIEASIRPRAGREAYRIEGTADLSAARLTAEGRFRKPEGVVARAAFRVETAGDSISLDPAEFTLAGSVFDVRGDLSAERVDVRLETREARFEDVRSYVPAIPLRALRPFFGRGAFAGRFAYRTEGPGAFAFDGEADLTPAGLRVGRVLDKPPGVPAAFRLAGRAAGGEVWFETGLVTIAGSGLLFQGTAGETAGRYQIFGTSIDLGALKSLLTQQWVRDYRLLYVDGPAIARALLRTEEGRWDVVGLIDLSPTRVVYGDTLDKPPGVLMSADYEVSIRPEVIELRNLDLRLGGSLVYMNGRIERGTPARLALQARADLDASEVRLLVPGLSAHKIMGRPVANVLRTMSDSKGRFSLDFDVVGTSESPDIVPDVRRAFFEAMGNAMESHIRTIFQILPFSGGVRGSSRR